jgi:hypothetical protein
VQSIVTNTSFQAALLACTVELISFAAAGEPDFPALTARLGLMEYSFDMWEALLYLRQLLLMVCIILWQELHCHKECANHRELIISIRHELI